jgi:flagellar motor component MotA
MSPIGAIIFGILIITGMMLAAGNYTKLGFSTNAWIAVNAALFAALVVWEIIHKIRSTRQKNEEEKKDDSSIG